MLSRVGNLFWRIVVLDPRQPEKQGHVSLGNSVLHKTQLDVANRKEQRIDDMTSLTEAPIFAGDFHSVVGK